MEKINFEKIKKEALFDIEKAADLNSLEEARLKYLGRKGVISEILSDLKNSPEQDRAKTGKTANELKINLEAVFRQKIAEFESEAKQSKKGKDWLDITRPGEKLEKGHYHPLTKITRRVENIFSSMGFEIAEGPEVETEYYNFDALNIPADHPSREMHDTFWLKSGQKERILLRTHTSPVQIHYMRNLPAGGPPLRIIAPGKVFRYEASDASHDFQFHQIECLVVDKNISVANLKWAVETFFSRLFGGVVKSRLRPSYFPFVEPGFEFDISCVNCSPSGILAKKSDKKACSVCKQTGWLEMGGAGMVHPDVLRAGKINPNEWQGFAFGMGMDRLAMMKYKIDDIRLMRSGDMRFIRQF